jgi:hypothetical protein
MVYVMAGDVSNGEVVCQGTGAAFFLSVIVLLFFLLRPGDKILADTSSLWLQETETLSRERTSVILLLVWDDRRLAAA